MNEQLNFLDILFPTSDEPKAVGFEPLVRLLDEYRERLNYWHKFQDENKMIGNSYWWWNSRWCEDHQTHLGNFKENFEKQNMFKQIWKNYQQEFTRLNWIITEAT